MILQCFIVTQYNKSLPSSAMIENEWLTVSIHLNGYFSKEVKELGLVLLPFCVLYVTTHSLF